jgi:hypothetical protein
LPANRLTPRMENMRNTTTMTTPTLKMEPRDAMSASIRVFMLELWETNLSGLRIRNSLMTLITGMSTPSKKVSKSPVLTMKQSS